MIVKLFLVPVLKTIDSTSTFSGLKFRLQALIKKRTLMTTFNKYLQGNSKLVPGTVQPQENKLKSFLSVLSFQSFFFSS